MLAPPAPFLPSVLALVRATCAGVARDAPEAARVAAPWAAACMVALLLATATSFESDESPASGRWRFVLMVTTTIANAVLWTVIVRHRLLGETLRQPRLDVLRRVMLRYLGWSFVIGNATALPLVVVPVVLTLLVRRGFDIMFGLATVWSLFVLIFFAMRFFLARFDLWLAAIVAEDREAGLRELWDLSRPLRWRLAWASCLTFGPTMLMAPAVASAADLPGLTEAVSVLAGLLSTVLAAELTVVVYTRLRPAAG